MDSDEGRLFADNADYMTGIFVERAKALGQKGRLPSLWSSDVIGLLRQMLSTSTYAAYAGYIKESEGKWTDDWSMDCPTEATELKEVLVTAVTRYAVRSAALAKEIGSGSLDLWVELIDRLDCPLRYDRYGDANARFGKDYYTEDEADMIVKLLQQSVCRLRQDLIIAHLPKFTAEKRTVKKAR